MKSKQRTIQGGKHVQLLAGLVCSLMLLCPLSGTAATANESLAQAEYPAVPESVTLYPSGARLSVIQTVPVVDGAIRLLLPAGVSSDSITLTPDGRTVRSLSLEPVAEQDSPSVSLARQKFEAARDAVLVQEGVLEALKAQRALWSKPDVKMEKAAELERLDQLIGERLRAVYLEQGRVEAGLERVRAERDRLRQALDEAGGLASSRLVLRADVSPATAGMVRVALRYNLKNCAWRPMYRIEANSAKSEIQIVHDVEVRQGSGVDWKGVRLTLATSDPGRGLDPLPLQKWTIRPQQEVRPRMSMPAPNAMMATGMLAQQDVEKDVIHQQEFATFSSWDLGKRDVSTGKAQRLTLQQETWPAVFSRLVRPARDPRVFLRAVVSLPEPRALPTGSASWFVDGESVGSGSFGLNGDNVDLFFGVDPRVTAKMQLDTRQSGRKGFVDRRQTRVWSWSIELNNAHTQPVTIQVEDAEPRAGDQGITLEATSEPKPKIEDHLYIWTLELPANTKRTIRHKIAMSAPDDMQLDEGR